MRPFRGRTHALLVPAFASITVFAALPEAATSRDILLAMGTNAKQMVHYGWKQRITVVRKGNPSEPIVQEVHFDSTGQMQRTTISAPDVKETGGIRGRVAAGVRENVKGMMALAGEYNKPQQMLDFIKKAHISESSDGSGAVLQASKVLDPDDSMTMRLNSRTQLAKHIDIQTRYQGRPMTIAQDYSPLPDGPNVMRTMNVSAPEKGLAVHVDCFDFSQQNPTSKP